VKQCKPSIGVSCDSLENKLLKLPIPREGLHMVGVMHFYFLGLDSLFLKKIFDNFQFQYIYGQKLLKVILKSILPLGPFSALNPS
jgi:hypothetical protein